MVAAILAADVVAAARTRRGVPTTSRQAELTATTTIRRPRREVYEFWRRLENLPTFMAHVDDVITVDEGRSRWRATAPFDRTVSWVAQLTDDVPDTLISWRSVGPTPTPNSGSVTFSTAPDGVSTEVHVRLRYDLPGGKIGAAVARYFGEEPHQQVDDDLRRLKQVMEAGEVMRSDGAPAGKRARHELRQPPAVPRRADRVLEGVS